jgi:hypothetical protein
MINPGGAAVGVISFALPAPQTSRYIISGVTRNAAGAVLPFCTVDVYESVSDLRRNTTVSDANGNYTLEVNGPATGFTFYLVAYLAGSPDVAGTSVNTLVGVDA